jgi:hypothetical protein
MRRDRIRHRRSHCAVVRLADLEIGLEYDRCGRVTS